MYTVEKQNLNTLCDFIQLLDNKIKYWSTMELGNSVKGYKVRHLFDKTLVKYRIVIFNNINVF
jgi:hypothetical protein